jgi:hypothetical protein
MAMNGDVIDEGRTDDLDDEVDEPEDTVVFEDVDNIGDLSVEINVEELVAKLESAGDDDVEGKRAIRNRLEELREQKDPELDSTYNFNLDDDI